MVKRRLRSQYRIVCALRTPTKYGILIGHWANLFQLESCPQHLENTQGLFNLAALEKSRQCRSTRYLSCIATLQDYNFFIFIIRLQINRKI